MPEPRRVQRFALAILFPVSVGKQGSGRQFDQLAVPMFSNAHREQNDGQRPTLRFVGTAIRIIRVIRVLCDKPPLFCVSGSRTV